MDGSEAAPRNVEDRTAPRCGIPVRGLSRGTEARVSERHLHHTCSPRHHSQEPRGSLGVRRQVEVETAQGPHGRRGAIPPYKRRTSYRL